MITAARLRPYNKRNGQPKRTHTTASGIVYRAGTQDVPSPVRIVESKAELRELEQMPEFQILSFETREELDRYLQEEMYGRVRLGAAPQMAVIQGAVAEVGGSAPAALPVPPRPQAAPVAAVLAPTPAHVYDEADDEDKIAPPEVAPQVAALVAPTPVGEAPVSAPVDEPKAPAAAPSSGRIKAGRKPGKK